jgi:hypothetical protein
MQRMSAAMGFGFWERVGPMVFLSDSQVLKQNTEPNQLGLTGPMVSLWFRFQQNWLTMHHLVPWNQTKNFPKTPKLTHMVSITPMHG